MAEWNFETVYLVTVAGPRWDFTSFPIKPFLGHLRTPRELHKAEQTVKSAWLQAAPQELPLIHRRRR